MLNLSALLRDDPLKPAMPLTNGTISETLRQFAPLSDDRMLQLVDCREWSTLIKPSVEGHSKQRNRLDSSTGCLGATCEAR